MTQQATDTAPATTDTAPDGDAQTTQTTDTQNTDTQTLANTGDTTNTEGDRAPINNGAQTPDFSLPDEYKGKPWAEKIKSNDDAFKQIDNLTALVGKKTIPPIDYSTATPEEIAAHHSSLAPENIEDYSFSEGADPEMSKAIGETFQEFGINKYQADGLSKKIADISAKMVEEKTKTDTSEEAYMKMMEESFGENHKETAGIIEKMLKEHTKLDDDKKIFDKMDNSHRAAIDRTIHSVSEFYENRIKAILEEHGVTESGAQVEGSKGVNTGINVKEVRTDLRNKISEISARPHTAEDLQFLKDKLTATYK